MTKQLLLSSLLLLTLISLPTPTSAQTADLEVSGWIPYWREREGTRDARNHLKELDEINPFAYAVKQDGTLNDLMQINKSPWTRLIKDARAKKVRVVPTVMWSDSLNIDRVLRDSELRKKHIKSIVDVVKKGKFDGIDIDYEGKMAQSKIPFSLFLVELKVALGNKHLSCTIEARTPPESLYSTPRDIQYVNDFAIIGQVCDRVKIMAYDQQRADIKLNAQHSAVPYAPVADVDWVRKVMTLTAETIPKSKLVVGIPTYGYEFEIIANPGRYGGYAKVWALNPQYGEDTAKKYKTDIGRSEADEPFFTYRPSGTNPQLPADLNIPRNTPKYLETAVKAMTYANNTGQLVPFYLVTWSDAEAIKTKINLAQELGLRGVAIFKIDGAEDREIWDLLR